MDIPKPASFEEFVEFMINEGSQVLRSPRLENSTLCEFRLDGFEGEMYDLHELDHYLPPGSIFKKSIKIAFTQGNAEDFVKKVIKRNYRYRKMQNAAMMLIPYH